VAVVALVEEQLGPLELRLDARAVGERCLAEGVVRVVPAAQHARGHRDVRERGGSIGAELVVVVSVDERVEQRLGFGSAAAFDQEARVERASAKCERAPGHGLRERGLRFIELACGRQRFTADGRGLRAQLGFGRRRTHGELLGFGITAAYECIARRAQPRRFSARQRRAREHACQRESDEERPLHCLSLAGCAAAARGSYA
jgi:hypothetical protein